MIRWLLLFLGGALLGGIVHLGTIIIMPRTATQDAYSRLARIAPVNTVSPLPAPTPESAPMPYMDPAAGPDKTHGPGQHGLYVRVVLYALRCRLLRHQ
jgi:hypothetical protein